MIRVKVFKTEDKGRRYLVEGRKGARYVARSGSTDKKEERKALVQSLIAEVTSDLTPQLPA